jgi:hypothetical protein
MGAELSNGPPGPENGGAIVDTPIYLDELFGMFLLGELIINSQG